MNELRERLAWPSWRTGEALQHVCRLKGVSARTEEAPEPSEEAVARGELGEWLEATAGWMGLEAEPLRPKHGDLDAFLRGPAPVWVELPGDVERVGLLVLNHDRARVHLLGPDLKVHRVPRGRIRELIAANVEAGVSGEVDALLDSARARGRRRAQARRRMLDERLKGQPVAQAWLLRLPVTAGIGKLFVESGVRRRLVYLVAAHAAQYVLWLFSWALIGGWCLSGSLDLGRVFGWLLVLLTHVPLRLLVTWNAGVLSVAVGARLKQYLLAAALRMESEDMRSRGVGQLLGRVIDTDAIESLATSGGFFVLTAAVELVLAGAVMVTGAAGWLHTLFFAAVVGYLVYGAWQYLRARRTWTDARLDLTHDFIERIVGHRTRVVQEVSPRLHVDEDAELAQYTELSDRMDRRQVALSAIIPRWWLALSIVAILPAFMSNSVPTTRLAVSVGAIYLGFRALSKLVAGLGNVTGAMVAWDRMAPFFAAMSRPVAPQWPRSGAFGPKRAASDSSAVLLSAHELVYRYRARNELTLGGASLQIRRGDRVLLEGRFGEGKSTLAAMLAGLREPNAGLILFEGLDRQTLGTEAWSRRVVLAPQFHENHVVSGSLAFNLLMGRRWPPRQEDLADAEAVCRELGLGELLERMPARLDQLVGETGWQLSHGERSRLFLARALLKGAQLVVLDESLAGLDPETIHGCLLAAARRAEALLVVLHR